MTEIKKILNANVSWIFAAVMTVTISALNFAAQKFAADITTSEASAKALLIYFSEIILLAGLISHTIYFTNPNSSILTINGSTLLVVALLGLATLYKYPQSAFFLLMLIAGLVTKEFYKLFGEISKITKYSAISYLSASIIAFLVSIYMIDFEGGKKIFVLFFFLIQFLPILLLINHKKNINFRCDVSNLRNTLIVFLSEILPFLSGYLLLISSSDHLSTKEFIIWREVLAILSLSTLFGGVFLNIFARGYSVKTHYLYLMISTATLATILSCSATLSQATQIALSLTVFTVSSIIHNYNKVKLSRIVYLIVSAAGPICVVVWQFRVSTIITSQHYLEAITLIQCSHVVISVLAHQYLNALKKLLK